MSDPFARKNSEQQLVREAKVGFSILMVAIVTIGGWFYYQYDKYQNRIPPHILNAPVAQHVGPDYYLRNLNEKNPVRTFAYPGERMVGEPAAAPTDSRLTSVPDTSRAETKTSFAQPRRQAFSSQPISMSHVESSRADNAPDIPVTPLPAIVETAAVEAATVTEPQKTLPVVVSLPNPFEQASDEVSSKLASTQPPTSTRSNGSAKTPPARLNRPSQQFVGMNLSSKAAPAIENNVLRDDAVIQTAFEEPSEVTTTQPAIASPNDFAPESNDFAPEPNDFVATPTPNIDNQTAKLPSSDQARNIGDVETADQAKSNQTPAMSNVPDVVTEQPSPATQHDSTPQHDAASQPVLPLEYDAKTGDSFWSIAQQMYGDGRYFRALFQHNRSIVADFENIAVGTKLNVPLAKTLNTSYPELCPADAQAVAVSTGKLSAYETSDGDTLFDIARKTTGQASRYLEILKLNKELLPPNVGHLTRLDAGITLRLPK